VKVWQTSNHRPLRLGEENKERRRRRKEEETTGQKYNGLLWFEIGNCRREALST